MDPKHQIITMRFKEPDEWTNISTRERTKQRIISIWKEENSKRSLEKKMGSYDAFLNEVLDILEEEEGEKNTDIEQG